MTAEAKDIAQSDGYQRDLQANTQFGAIPSRVPLNASFSKKGKDDRMKAKRAAHSDVRQRCNRYIWFRTISR